MRGGGGMVKSMWSGSCWSIKQLLSKGLCNLSLIDQSNNAVISRSRNGLTCWSMKRRGYDAVDDQVKDEKASIESTSYTSSKLCPRLQIPRRSGGLGTVVMCDEH